MADIKNVEIMRTGIWNRDKFTLEHLKSLAANFAKLDYKVPVKLGHDPSPSAPAYGWLSDVRLNGERLVADFTDVPDKLVDMIRQKMFDFVSSEIYFNLTRDGKKFDRALKAVALLGANIPAVSGLKPLSSSLSFDADADSVFNFSFDVGQDFESFMAKHGSEEIEIGIPFLKTLDYNLAEDAGKAGAKSISFRLEALPNELVDGLNAEFGLDAKAHNLYEICGDKISSNPHISGSLEPLCTLLCRKLNGEYSLKPKQQEADMALLKLLSLIIATRSKTEKRDDVIKEFAVAAGMEVKDFSEMLEGKKTVELSESQTDSLAVLLAPAEKDDGSDASKVAALQLELNDERKKTAALEGDNEKVTELSNQVESLQADARARSIRERVAKVKLPSLRSAFQGLYELAEKATDKVRVYSTDGKKFEETEAVAVVDSLVDQINQKMSKLFAESSDGGHDYGLEGTDKSASEELDEKALAYQEKHEGTYTDACAAILAADSGLNQRYSQEG